jgi:hypothetical protein
MTINSSRKRARALANIRRLIKENHPDFNHSVNANRNTRFLIGCLGLMKSSGQKGYVTYGQVKMMMDDYNKG